MQASVPDSSEIDGGQNILLRILVSMTTGTLWKH